MVLLFLYHMPYTGIHPYLRAFITRSTLSVSLEQFHGT